MISSWYLRPHSRSRVQGEFVCPPLLSVTHFALKNVKAIVKPKSSKHVWRGPHKVCLLKLIGTWWDDFLAGCPIVIFKLNKRINHGVYQQ
ncbi:unnamed protein product [Allacma fusca]|uniref:Uncharacterized protein n=1 Tax=Allacma fusca TaxID=39272 RepID=A0A8J2M5Z3_9HEXA|nr:unnamed protein product [Allacma fusca]